MRFTVAQYEVEVVVVVVVTVVVVVQFLSGIVLS